VVGVKDERCERQAVSGAPSNPYVSSLTADADSLAKASGASVPLRGTEELEGSHVVGNAKALPSASQAICLRLRSQCAVPAFAPLFIAQARCLDPLPLTVITYTYESKCAAKRCACPGCAPEKPQTNNAMTRNTEVGADATKSPIVWDNVWPLEPDVGNDYAGLKEHARAGVDVASITIAGDKHNISQAMLRTALARRAILSDDACFHLVETMQDVYAAKRAGKLAVVLHFEGTRCFEREIAVIEAFWKLGVRQTLLAFNSANSVGGGCTDLEDGGLTRYGRRVVAEMQRVGMLVDLSHTGYRTSLDAMELSTKPCVFSHSNVFSLRSHPRNIKDAQIRACAATGGLVGISGASDYLGDDTCSTEALFRHVDYIAALVGPKYVGLGLDIVNDSVALNQYVRSRLEEWPFAADPDWAGFRYAKPGQIHELAALLLVRGYARDDVNGILGGNYERVCSAAWV
jgi:membrane dipeptidase